MSVKDEIEIIEEPTPVETLDIIEEDTPIEEDNNWSEIYIE